MKMRLDEAQEYLNAKSAAPIYKKVSAPDQESVIPVESDFDSNGFCLGGEDQNQRVLRIDILHPENTKRQSQVPLN